MGEVAMFANHLEEIESGMLALGHVLLLSCDRAGCVTAFASNFYLLRPGIPAGVATEFFAGAHHTTARNVRTGALLRVIHQFFSKFVVNEKKSLMHMPARPPRIPNWQNCRRSLHGERWMSAIEMFRQGD
jgi:hypothetical protein